MYTDVPAYYTNGQQVICLMKLIKRKFTKRRVLEVRICTIFETWDDSEEGAHGRPPDLVRLL